MSELTDFLRDRLADEEATARQEPANSLGGSPRLGWVDVGPGHALLVHPSRVLADVEVKRETIELLETDLADPHNAVRRSWAAEILWHMAAVYSGHPNYRQSWRPWQSNDPAEASR